MFPTDIIVQFKVAPKYKSRVIVHYRYITEKHVCWYTAIEDYAPELGDGIWKHREGSASGHPSEKEALTHAKHMVSEEEKRTKEKP